MTARLTELELGHLLRTLAPQVLAALTRRHGDFAEAEDAVQEALIAAARQWPAEGAPRHPRGWLYQVARRRLTDQVRSELARRRREDAVAALLATDAALAPLPEAEFDREEDDTLLLLYMCCHPAISTPSAIALTLRAVGGLTTAEIARAFLVPEATMAQRISRAKQTIKSSRIPFQRPSDTERESRLAAVLHVLYLIFNEGYAASTGTSLRRDDLAAEAIRLTRLICSMLPEDGEAAGLLALMLLTDARRGARTGPGGELIPLDEQDRSLWDQPMIREGISLVSGALRSGPAGPYLLQAAIAAVHDEAQRPEDTDWEEILALYGVLMRLSDNPMVALNHAIATAMVQGPAAGLALLPALDADERLRGHYRLDAVRGHLHARAGNVAEAVRCLRLAAERTASRPERDYLLKKVLSLSAPEPE